MKAAARTERDRRAERLEQRLAVPVIIAAALSVPAVFLTTVGDGRIVLVGTALNWASLGVLTAESMVLFILAGDRIAWVRQHKWTLGLTTVATPAVVFAIAPVQALRVVLRAVRFVSAFRVLRANRIIKAGRVLARRTGLDGRWRYLPILSGSLVAAVFVALILADPTSFQTHRRAVEEIMGWAGIVPVLVAGGILAAATFVVLRHRRRD